MKKEYEENTKDHKPYGFGNFLPVEKDPYYKEPAGVEKTPEGAKSTETGGGDQEGGEEKRTKFEDRCHKVK